MKPCVRALLDLIRPTAEFDQVLHPDNWTRDGQRIESIQACGSIHRGAYMVAFIQDGLNAVCYPSYACEPYRISSLFNDPRAHPWAPLLGDLIDPPRMRGEALGSPAMRRLPYPRLIPNPAKVLPKYGYPGEPK